MLYDLAPIPSPLFNQHLKDLCVMQCNQGNGYMHAEARTVSSIFYHSFALRQGLFTEPQGHCFGKSDWTYKASVLQFWDCGHMKPWIAFTWLLGIQTQVHVLAEQATLLHRAFSTPQPSPFFWRTSPCFYEAYCTFLIFIFWVCVYRIYEAQASL